jgi:hypothetical protein
MSTYNRSVALLFGHRRGARFSQIRRAVSRRPVLIAAGALSRLRMCYRYMHDHADVIFSFKNAIALMLALEIASTIYYYMFYKAYGYIPAPFIYNKENTFMDFFNVFYWVDSSDRYTSWQSVYPPLNFLFIKALRMLFYTELPFEVGEHARSAAFVTFLPVLAIYVLTPIYVVATPLWRGFSGGQRALVGLTILLSPVFLFTLERGNLIIFSLVLAATALAYSGPRRALAIALLINVKPYCVLLVLVFFSRKRFPELLQILAMSGFIFLVSGLILDPNFLKMIFNIMSFGQSDSNLSVQEVLALPSSSSAFSFLLRFCVSGTDALPANGDGYGLAYAAITLTNLAIVASSLLIIAVRNELVSEEQGIVVLLVAVSNLGVSVGGYSMLVYPAMIPVLLTMPQGRFYVFAIAVIMIPWDMITLTQEPAGRQLVYLSGRSVDVMWQLGAGAIVRPLTNLVLLIGLVRQLFFAPSAVRGIRDRTECSQLA